MINYKLISYLVILAGLLFSRCSESPKNKCSEFYDNYPRIISRMGNSPDTILLVNFLSKMLDKDSQCLDALLTRADLYLAVGKVQEAKEDLYRIISLDTGNVYALFKLGLAFQNESKDYAALYYFQKAIRIKSRGNTAINYYNQDNGLSDRKSKYDIDYDLIIYKQGVSFYFNRDLKSSFINFNYCIQKKFMLDRSYLYRGAIYLETNRKESACKDFLEAKKWGSQDAEDYLLHFCK